MDEPNHHWPDKQCYYCGEPAVAGCDGVEYYNATLFDGVPRVSMKDPEAVVWCERPLCEEHAITVGMSTVSGRVDTVDYCPKHITMQKLGQEPELKIR